MPSKPLTKVSRHQRTDVRTSSRQQTGAPTDVGSSTAASTVNDMRKITFKFTGTCRACHAKITAGTAGWWDRDGTTFCVSCGETGKTVKKSGAGASADYEYQKRSQTHSDKVRRRWGNGKVGSVAAALTPTPQHVKAWNQGAVGERKVGAKIDRVVSRHGVALHDRLVPGTKANIDHIIVTRHGIWVVDAKNYSGTPKRRNKGSWWRPKHRLYVGPCDQTSLIDGVKKQLKVVSRYAPNIPVRGCLSFVQADITTLPRSFKIDGITIMRAGQLRSQIFAGPKIMTDAEVAAAAKQLNKYLVAA